MSLIASAASAVGFVGGLFVYGRVFSDYDYELGYEDGYHYAELALSQTSAQQLSTAVNPAHKALQMGTTAYVLRSLSEPRCRDAAPNVGIFFEDVPVVMPGDEIVQGLIHVMPIERGNGPWDAEAAKVDPNAFHLTVGMYNGGPTIGAIAVTEHAH